MPKKAIINPYLLDSIKISYEHSSVTPIGMEDSKSIEEGNL